MLRLCAGAAGLARLEIRTFGHAARPGPCSGREAVPVVSLRHANRASGVLHAAGINGFPH